MGEKRLILNEKQIEWFNDHFSLLYDLYEEPDDISVLRRIVDALMFLIDTQTEEYKYVNPIKKLMEENNGSNCKF